MTEIDPYPISALQDRYGLSSKQAVYDRINKLGIQSIARGKISSSQLDRLDRLDEWLQKGRKIDDFVNGQIGQTMLLARNEEDPADKQEQIESVGSFALLVHQIAAAVKSQPDPLQHYESLERAVRNNWLLSTSEVKQLIGVKPYGAVCVRGSFAFIKSGKIGGQTAWRVEKA